MAFNPDFTNWFPVSKFRFWCQKVIPLVYDDSLSYYEVLCKVVDYLNRYGENLGVLENDYIALVEYVNHYFDDGVPDLIMQYVNEWLDDHPEATTTVQDHSLTYTKLVNGTLGFVTPQMYGAKGDGVADDTDAIKTAITSNSCVFFPSGTYNVAFDDSVTEKQVMFSLHSGQNILFDKDAIINITGSAFAGLSSVFGFTEFPVNNVVIEGATIQCASLHSTNPMGIRFETPSDANAEQITNVTINNCVFKNLDSAVYIAQRRTTGVETRQTKNVCISNCKGFSCLSSFVTADGENITIKNCIADGQGNAGAYDAVSVHSGINIKILNNVFKGYTIGQVINIRNSPENHCGTRDVLISGNSIVDCTTIAIQISVTSGESTYGTTNVTIDNNQIYNCSTGLVISCGTASSGTPFGDFAVENNIIKECLVAANLQSTTTVWNERMTIANNIFDKSGNLKLNACRHCTFIGNYINLKTDATFTANNFYYSDFSGNIVWADNTEISFDTVVYVGISSNFFKGVVKLASFSNADFFGNICMNLLTINGTAGYSVKTDYRHGQIITYSNNRPTGSTTAFNKGDMFINSDLSTDVYAWVCTASGSPGTWKAISLA